MKLIVGDCELDRQRGLLLRGGVEVPLRPKSFDVLCYLVDRPERLVSREELLDAVWGQVVVTEGSVTQCLVDIRRALGDDAGTLIRTIPKRGYLYQPPSAETNSDVPQVPPDRRRTLVAAGIGAIAALLLGWYLLRDSSAPESADGARPQAIAVLPLADLSADGSQQYFSDGLSEELIHRLTQELQIPVIARTSSFAFRGKPLGIPEIARDLGVSHVLEGSVRRSGENIRITVQLIDASRNAHVWSQVYDRTMTDLLGVQRDVAVAVASRLRLSLAPTARRDSRDPDSAAYDEWLVATYYYNRRLPGDTTLARDHFARATELDQGFARAWAGLAAATALMGDEGTIPRPVALSRQFEAISRALELDPNSAEVLMRHAEALIAKGDIKTGVAQLRRATTLEPNNLLAMGAAAGSAMVRGRIEEAIELQQRIIARDPLSIVSNLNLAVFLFLAGRFDEAMSRQIRAASLAGVEPGAAADLGGIDYVRTLVAKGRFSEALQLAERWQASYQKDATLALIFLSLGRPDDAQPAMRRLAMAADSLSTAGKLASATEASIRLTELLAYQGDLDAAFSWLARADALLAGRWDAWRGELRYSPFAQAMRQDARWQPWAARWLKDDSWT